MSCRCKMAQVRSLCTDLIRNVYIQFNTSLMGDSRQMQHAVGAAAKSHIHGQGVAECCLGHDISRTDVFL